MVPKKEMLNANKYCTSESCLCCSAPLLSLAVVLLKFKEKLQCSLLSVAKVFQATDHCETQKTDVVVESKLYKPAHLPLVDLT